MNSEPIKTILNIDVSTTQLGISQSELVLSQSIF